MCKYCALIELFITSFWLLIKAPKKSKITRKQNKFNRTAEESIIIGYERGTKKMVESECTRVLYRRVNMFYILPVSVIHWRAAAPTHRRAHTRHPSVTARRVASLSEMPSFNKTYIFPSEENTGETRNLFFHFMLVYKTKVEHFRNIMLIL